MIKTLLKKYYKIIIFIIVFTIVQALANLLLPNLMSSIVTDGIIKQDMDYIINTGLKMIGLTIGASLLSVFVSYLTAKFGASIACFLREEIFIKITKFNRTNFKKFNTSSLLTRTNNDITQIQMAGTMMFKMVTLSLVMGIGGTIMAITQSNGMNALAIAVGVAVGLVLLLLVIIYFVILPKFELIQKLLDKISAKTRESLNGILVIRAFNQQKKEEHKFENINEEYSKTDLFLNKAVALFNPYLYFILNGISIAIVWIVAYSADNIDDIGSMLAFQQYAIQIVMAFLAMSMLFIFIPRAGVSYKRIMEVINTEDEKKLITNTIKDLKGKIEFKKVYFKYPDAEEHILKSISFEAKPGTTTAFIGSTGSGKSTVIQLIPKLYNINEGEILLDGYNINELDEKYLRDNIGYASQKASLFSGTIKTNLTLGDKEIKDNDLNDSLKMAELSNFTLDQEVAQSGSNLSGGQKQRVSIARALAKKPKILIFDDSFSALDFKTDSKIRKSINNNFNDSTIIIVAQRIGTILNADNIIVLNDGEIESQGTHEELKKKSKIYQEILFSQYGKEEI